MPAALGHQQNNGLDPASIGKQVMAITIVQAGTFDGKRVDEAILESDSGVKVFLMNWGVTVRDWQVPMQDRFRSVVLGFDDFAPYPEHSPYFGSLAGRVANRIDGASFELDGQNFALAANEGANILHGGANGIGRQLWSMAPDSDTNAVKFTLHSPDGDMGFPGAVDFEATYSLSGNTLRLELVASPGRPTPISLVQHQYFNLGSSDTVLDHQVHIPHGEARTVNDVNLTANGEIVPIADTEFDFRQPRTLRDADGAPIVYDCNLVLTADRDAADPIVIATGEDGALTLKLWSDRPGLQLYNGAWTDVKIPGHGGKIYGKHSGLCFEDQMFPNAVNHPHFPNIICTPEQPYRHFCEIEIG